MPSTILIREMFAWLRRFEQLSVATAVLLLSVSAIAVVYSSHMTRQMYRNLQVLHQDQDDLDSEYEKLLLEQSAWADYTRVDQLAREELNMSPPAKKNLYIVRETAQVSTEFSQ
jgi:cell division protein FtsL